MMMFNLQMKLVLYANLKVTKIFSKKMKKKILEQTDKYLTENQLTLNADKTEIKRSLQIILIRIQSLLLKVKLKSSSYLSLFGSTN